MKNVFVANFGRENYEWPTCRKDSAIATMNDLESQRLWEANDREGYIAYRMKTKTWAGHTPSRAVASRWFNLMGHIVQSSNEIWIHRDENSVWWTESLSEPAYFRNKVEPVGDMREVVVCYKPCRPWSNKDLKGRPLSWRSLHPKARDFMATESTLQKLSEDNADFVRALIAGESLEPWHSRQDWKDKLGSTKGPRATVSTYTAKERSVCSMTLNAQAAAKASGSEVTSSRKIKEFRFSLSAECEAYLKSLLEMQEGLCALSQLKLQFEGDHDDEELLCSLDRIDSDGHYERGNLQIVCRFINRWKGTSDDIEFRQLIRLVSEAT